MASGTKTPKERFLARVEKLSAEDKWDEVRAACEKFIDKEGESAEAFFFLALAAFGAQDPAGALALAKRACEMDPMVSEYADFAAMLYGRGGDLHSATFYAKLAAAGNADERVKAWVPDSMPSFTQAFLGIQEKPLLAEALGAASQGNWAGAEHWFRQHLAFHPRDEEAYAGLANSLMLQGSFRAAVEILRAARHVIPEDARSAHLLGTALTAIAAFDEAAACHRWAEKLAPDDPMIHAGRIGNMLFDPACTAAGIAAEARRWGAVFGPRAAAGIAPRGAGPKRRLTVGYVIGAMDRARTAPALAEVLSAHDSQRVRVVGFGLGQLSDAHNVMFQKCCESWLDIHDTDPLTFASMAAAEDVDILVDLGGFTAPRQLVAFGARVAPVQVAWWGAPCGTGLAETDALIGDGFLDPAGADRSFLPEPTVALEGGAVLANLPRFSGAAEGDGAPSMIFGADVTLAELDPHTIEIWAEILRAAPEATLLLMDRDFRNDDNVARLGGLFGNFGLAHRVDVVSDTPAEVFFRGVDVALIPAGSMRPEAASAALEAGIPVVCLAGRERHRRQVGSFLHHLGLAEDTVAETPEAYRDRAVAFINDPAVRQTFRDGLAARIETSPMADVQVRARALEAIYEDLWQAALGEGTARVGVSGA